MNRIEFIISNNLQPYYINFFDFFMMLYDLNIKYRQIKPNNNCIILQLDYNDLIYINNNFNNRIVNMYNHIYKININIIDNNTMEIYLTFMGVSG